MLLTSLSARKERGRPPLSHNCCSASEPNSASENPPMTIRFILPARLSEVWRMRLPEALPRIRNRACALLRSACTRNTGKSSGCRWISSITTNPYFMLSNFKPASAASRVCLSSNVRNRSALIDKAEAT